MMASDDNPDLYLVRGQRYTFINNSGGSHPFQISSSSGGSAYSDGVTNNGASSGNIVLMFSMMLPNFILSVHQSWWDGW